MSARKRPKGSPHAGAWRLAQSMGQNRCAYCRNLFTEQSPPTKDHIRTAHDDGNRAGAGWVLACQLCNNARGPAPHDKYLEAVLAEHQHAELEHHAYRRPTYRSVPGGGYTISTESKSAANKRLAEERQRRAAS